MMMLWKKPRRMKRNGLLILLLGLLAGILLGAVVLFVIPGSKGNANRQLPPTVGSQAQDFELDNLSGEVVRLSSLKGKPIVLNFWATWCKPCEEELPMLEEYSKVFSRDMVVVGVNTAEDPNLVRSFIMEHNATFPIVLDEAGVVSEMYFVHNYPVTFFIDKDGVLKAQHLGQLDSGAMDRYLELIGVAQ